MKDFENKVALVTGSASGIGFGITRSLAERGVSVVMLDIEQAALDSAVAELSFTGASFLPMVVDVANREAMYATARVVQEKFGRLDILINNAGVAYNVKPLHETPDEAIDWSVNVNLFGVLNGIKAFVPLIIAGGQGGHVVNTSSIGGFQVRKNPNWHQGLYAATKYAVTALSEGLRLDLEDENIGVSVLAPAAVSTNILTSDRNRPSRFGGPTTGSQSELFADMFKQSGLAPEAVGERVIQAILDNELYIFTHLDTQSWLEERHRKIEAAFDATRKYLSSQNSVI
ncbi:SDR family NAD(P)-dependent oxidoreductase [Novosphingobium sp.]|uniref:SDR family NAD(P)-dependent oxidoreductase n=1 Tax=Novosphingobium sp. TaxID=1874826 RepID=UPI002FDAB8D4